MFPINHVCQPLVHWTGGKKNPTGQVDIATYQSLIDKRDNSISALTREYGQVIIDECHHILAPRYEMVINEINAKYVHGLTATPDRQDGHQKIMFMIAGPVRHKVISDHSKNFTQTVYIKHVESQPPSDSRKQIKDRISLLSINGSWKMTKETNKLLMT